MSIPLLTTKLYVPSVQPGLVLRSRLVERLNAGLGQRPEMGFTRKLTLVAAPAGFGKTTLLSEWANLRISESTKGTMTRPAFWLILSLPYKRSQASVS